MSRPEPKIADHVFVVVGSLPYEFQEPKSAWTTEAGAEAESKRLETLADQKNRTEAEDKDLGGCQDFWVVPLNIYHQAGDQP